jgi:thiosulfate dehydrogenase
MTRIGTLGRGVAILLIALAGLGAGYLLWGWPKDWYAFNDPAKLPASPQNELIQYGFSLVQDTPNHIGPLASDAAMRFAGNKLSCSNCHLNAGLQPFASPYVSTFATYPRMEMDTVETLTERINGCLTRSMNGKPLPADGREMNAIIAYIQYLGVGSPEGIRVPGMGLLALPAAAETPDAGRGATVFTSVCARCHGLDGHGNANPATGAYAVPPLWGDGSFNGAAGMATIETASAFIRANMPRGVDYRAPTLTVQQAWDVAAYVLAQPRPPGPAVDN